VVDVREAYELLDGYIPGSRHVPLSSLRDHVDELMQATELIFVCHVGERSAAATRAFTQAGHPNAYNMTGGMVAWMMYRLPVER
jgi:rhodanese-related sulfurtransferase